MPKHVVVPYVENTLYSTNKYSCVRRVHTLYIGYPSHPFYLKSILILCPNLRLGISSALFLDLTSLIRYREEYLA